LAERRGRQAGWNYEDTSTVTRLLERALLDKVRGQVDIDARLDLAAYVKSLCTRDVDPFPSCSTICSDHALCLYRHAVKDIIDDGDLGQSWATADAKDTAEDKGSRPASWAVAQQAGGATIEWPESDWPQQLKAQTAAAATRVSRCFAQQMITLDNSKTPRATRILINQVHD
jgi:hypothetical protein